MAKKWQGIKSGDLEKRLATAYEAGEFDGYVDGYIAGVDEAHSAWRDVSKTVKGIGTKTHEALLRAVEAEMRRRQDEKLGRPAAEAEEIREALKC